MVGMSIIMVRSVLVFDVHYMCVKSLNTQANIRTSYKWTLRGFFKSQPSIFAFSICLIADTSNADAADVDASKADAADADAHWVMLSSDKVLWQGLIGSNVLECLMMI